MTLVYLIIVAAVLILVVERCIKGEDLMTQATAAMVAIPLVLRLLRVK
ncbi:hypothetical protein TheveDRAFT_1731 [Thermanaerovibrio velox DSM 12556]|uniref:Uncharacterized protein n=1 Tax=Thermanaerovibrio velox DSM 12556 TaxID=926567 RepID=H0UR12_9BACT|nr:hypothetical protein [Thermanaerovibrio velox]EHM10849.1 hypothetical protein TheveDRAFT_1731 [Thermanaerovibrio velox DSM 12556]